MIAIKGMEMPKGCQHCKYFRKNLFGNGLDYSYSCMQGATEFPMPWIRQMEERASDCPLVEVVTSKDSLKQASDKYKIEQEIREELERLYTFRIPNTKTDLVSLKAVKRILNLVFRGCRDLDPNIANTNPFNDSRFGG